MRAHAIERLAWRWAPSLLALICMLVLTALYLSGARETYASVLTAWGINPFRFPFLDIGGSLSAWDCARRGIDVVIADPCDVLHRGYNYSPFWQTLSWIPLHLSDRPFVGFCLGATLIFSLGLLPPSQSLLELLCRCAATVSTMVVFAVERANPDLLLFLMTMAVAASASRSFGWRSGAYAVAMLEAAIKYYPVALLALIVRERGWRLAVVGAVIGLIGATFLYAYGPDISRGLPHIAAGSPFGDMFGAKNLIFGSYLLIHDALAAVGGVTSASIAKILNLIFQMAWLSGLLAFARKLWNGGDWRASVWVLPTWTRDLLACGALIIVGCFFAGQSVGYRGVFLLMILPGLAALARADVGGFVAPSARFAMIAIVPLMWYRPIWEFLPSSETEVWRADLAWGYAFIWLTNEVAWWLLILVLCMVLGGWILSQSARGESWHSAATLDHEPSEVPVADVQHIQMLRSGTQ